MIRGGVLRRLPCRSRWGGPVCLREKDIKLEQDICEERIIYEMASNEQPPQSSYHDY